MHICPKIYIFSVHRLTLASKISALLSILLYLYRYGLCQMFRDFVSNTSFPSNQSLSQTKKLSFILRNFNTWSKTCFEANGYTAITIEKN